NSGQATWCELACEAVGLAGNECRVEPIPSSQWPQKAPRPPYTVLDCGKLSEYLGMHPRPWTQALREHFFCDPFDA
ncbi:MAG: NAD(P)-dependent oxidoreductase, partial [Desulfovibrio piger]|nr:NAD(P)-dependent oxidoreductase [Desulfovibrio piger]